MPEVKANFSLQYTPPAAAAGSGVPSINTTATYQAQSVGTLDIPTTFVPGPVAIPFGTIQGAQVCVVQNLTANPIGIRYNGAVADEFQLDSGATTAYFGPTVPSVPLTSMDISVVTAPATTTEYINFWVFGV